MVFNTQDYQRNYYQTHKEELKEKNKLLQREVYAKGLRYYCDTCGCDMVQKYYLKHMTSNKHKRNKEEQLKKIDIDAVIKKEIETIKASNSRNKKLKNK